MTSVHDLILGITQTLQATCAWGNVGRSVCHGNQNSEPRRGVWYITHEQSCSAPPIFAPLSSPRMARDGSTSTLTQDVKRTKTSTWLRWPRIST